MTVHQKIIVCILFALNGVFMMKLQQPLEPSLWKTLGMVAGITDIFVAFGLLVRHI